MLPFSILNFIYLILVELKKSTQSPKIPKSIKSGNGGNNPKIPQDNYKTIFPTSNYYGFQFGKHFFKNCPYSNCEMGHWKNKNLSDYDAIMFENIRPNHLKFPRSPHQTYIFFMLETPTNQGLIDVPPHFINYTITYRRDSDLFRPYGIFQTLQELNNLTNKFLYTSQVAYDPKAKYPIRFNKTELQKKKNGVYWTVSHCGTKSSRETYVKELQEIII